ncbi:MAG TPA: TMEM14 family protein [Ignavibacteria bacterium]|nr:TMEM14 family protein [Ignavibacteria bacterium]HMR42011.1 TMEM14 family protein [Ignavibacteria bacterium]
MNIYRIMLANAFVLIVLGVYGYISSGSPTALIAPAIGVILIVLAFPIKNENKTAAHIGAGLTLIAAIMFFATGIMRNNLIVIVMAVFTTLALFMYIMDFKRRKQEREK